MSSAEAEVLEGAQGVAEPTVEPPTEMHETGEGEQERDEVRRVVKRRPKKDQNDVLGPCFIDSTFCVESCENLEGSSAIEVPSPKEVDAASPESLLVEQLQSELQAVEAEERDVEERLRLYEELGALKKRVAELREARAGAMAQLARGDISHFYDAATEQEAVDLETAVENSYLQGLWAQERQKISDKYGVELPPPWCVSIDDLERRLGDAREKFEGAIASAKVFYEMQEERINANTDARDKAKAQLQAECQDKVHQLRADRERLQQIDKEQRFHYRRGTHVKEVQVSKQKLNFVFYDRAVIEETRGCSQKYDLENEIKDLEDDILGLKRVLRDNKRDNQAVLRKLEKQLQDVEASGAGVLRAREQFEAENKELVALKHDLQCVLHYLRVRSREANF
ncbi:hypothetical protein ERJ75_000237600 [Trypanosoma vivax]|uniref:Uncharacterized protein n=2 Tax=Trypanosoma vivax (strain Y486) TaxID=1055687 RepID=F9WRE7_TRYVY|nr:hypothetical protein ERJ75_000237600 [Trypanosoma vivax]CCD20131.1 hypothetical protein, conserved [Trypanosoma vivax Y486]|eukprot:CCD20131.1 hypothetical protein, conserved [Trypanosoma vivax Y486]